MSFTREPNSWRQGQWRLVIAKAATGHGYECRLWIDNLDFLVTATFETRDEAMEFLEWLKFRLSATEIFDLTGE